MKTSDASQLITNIGFLLIPEFSMISLASLIEPLRMANQLKGETLYSWHIYGAEQEIYASNGLPFSVNRTKENTSDLDTLFVIAGTNVKDNSNAEDIRWIKDIRRQGVQLGATSTGTTLLAQAGILKHSRCTIHWENLDSLLEEFPDLNVTGELYEVDDNIYTCAGGAAGLDMMLHLIKTKYGNQLAKDVAEQFIHPKIRSSNEKQRMNLHLRYSTNNPKLLESLKIMRNNTEEILSCPQISRLIGVSTRQLERLFKESLNTSPSAYYLRIRLEKAHNLLTQSNLSILHISTACGFSSSSYFARCYKNQYKNSPNEQRKKTNNKS